MKKSISLLLVLALLLGLAACGVESKEGSSTLPDTISTTTDGVLKLQWFQQIGIDTLFECPWRDKQSLYIDMVFESLVSQNPDGSFIGKLASEWEISDDGLTYIFTLRDDVKWHDGKPLSAEDVVWSFNTNVKNPNSNYLSILESLEGYKDAREGNKEILSGVTADGNRIIFKLSAPNHVFLYGIAINQILPKHLLEKVAAADLESYEPFWSKPIGTGIYKIDIVSFPDYFTCVANPDYYGEKPSIQNVQFTSYAAGGNDAVVAALIAGDLDFAYGNSVNDIEVANNIVNQNSEMSYEMTISNYTRFFLFNNNHREDGKMKADIKNVTVRKAIDLAIDKEAIAACYSGQAVALSTMVNPDTPQYNSDIPRFKRDVEKAKQLLADANFDTSQTIDIAYYYDDQITADIMAMIKQNLNEVGVTVNTILLTGDLGSLIYDISNYDIIYCGYSGANDPIELYQTVTTSSYYTMIGLNSERKEFDEFVAAWLAGTDKTTIKEYGDKLQALGLETCYFVPGYALNAISIYNFKKLSIPKEIFHFDYPISRDWKFAEWIIKG